MFLILTVFKMIITRTWQNTAQSWMLCDADISFLLLQKFMWAEERSHLKKMAIFALSYTGTVSQHSAKSHCDVPVPNFAFSTVHIPSTQPEIRPLWIPVFGDVWSWCTSACLCVAFFPNGESHLPDRILWPGFYNHISYAL